ncbi:uncharacterized protein LOC110973709 isoform X1 [Acanthaster planci]|uniref:Uncharacterized protein LOC110973709 isoform X1 n=1 Tax=Acanthaster planci TaxID=133434 RepID=A0A8B7XHZ5_ACAPL|nr:uncharacterized protein LOC110973709 isoform X1 [Acanthaster planci]
MTNRARTSTTWGAHLPTARSVNGASQSLRESSNGCCRAPSGWFQILKLVALLVVLGALVALQCLQLAAPIEVGASISVVVVSIAVAYQVSKLKQAWEARRTRNAEASVRAQPNASAGHREINSAHISGRSLRSPPPSFQEATQGFPTTPPVTGLPNSRSSSTANPSCRRRLLTQLFLLLIAAVFLALLIVSILVPDVPISTGISFTVAFILVTIASRIPNIWRARKARRTRSARAEREVGVSSTAVPEEINGGRLNCVFVYDPPPYTEATGTSPPALTITCLPKDTPQGYRLTGTSRHPTVEPDVAAPPAETPIAANDPPPPSYEEAIANGAS